MAMLISDLHTEDWSYDHITSYISMIKLDSSGISCLIMAGDMGRIEKYQILFEFLHQLTYIFRDIIWVPGNHEYRSGERVIDAVKYGDQYMRNLVSYINSISEYGEVHFLNEDSLELTINGVKRYFLGCTLWTENKDLTDPPKDEHLSSKDRLIRHLHNKEWLRKNLINEPGKYIVITHHPPTSLFLEGDEYKEYYINHFEDLISLSKFWCYGHLHNSITTKIRGKMLYANPFGYLKEGTLYKTCLIDI